MLSLLKIKNIALIDELSLEFGAGLNLLTGETGSGKSIIVDSLGALTGERVSSDLIKDGEASSLIEGQFLFDGLPELKVLLDESGIETGRGRELELIVRREISSGGRNRVFINNQLVTQSFLKKIGIFLADIHGQGEQTTLLKPANQLEILDQYAGVEAERREIAVKYEAMRQIRSELEALNEDEAQKLQLIDILKFQINEISALNLETGEDELLEEEKKRLNNAEKLSTLTRESYALLYDNEDAVTADLERVARRISELSEYDSKFDEYTEGLESARAVLEDLAYTLRDFGASVEYSPARLEEIENRLAEISRVKRKYGGSVEMVLGHLTDSKQRLENIETAGIREKELQERLVKLRQEYTSAAEDLHDKRVEAAKDFKQEVEKNLEGVALENAKFDVVFADRNGGNVENSFTSKGFDAVEFNFSANPGESPKPLSKVASGGETSRLMLVIKTTAKTRDTGQTAVFDEVDAGIGGRVAEAVGLKLKELAKSQQVMCVTHHPQVSALADHHFLVEKASSGRRTMVTVRKLDDGERVAEISRMLAGENITETAREHARELLKGGKSKKKGTGK